MSKKSISPLPKIKLVTAFGNAEVSVAENRYGVECNAGLAFATDSHDALVMLIRTKGSKVQTLALIAHESYHLACQYFRLLGEENPGEETFAYVLDSIAYAAIRRYFKAGER
jgi:hypothetical protein